MRQIAHHDALQFLTDRPPSRHRLPVPVPPVSLSRRSRSFALCFAGLACACSGQANVSPAGEAGGGSGPSQPAARQHNPECVAPAGVNNAPRSIAETVTLLNALPMPVTLPCFLESLARPLEINATNSLFSAQPAQGARSPRIFLFRDPNTMSIVPAGAGAPLLEFGEQRPNYRSLKAQIEFPVVAPLSLTAPYQDLSFSDQLTSCGVCHASEQQESNLSGVQTYVSQSLRPLARDFVSADDLRNEWIRCDSGLEADRCAMLDGLLGWGPVGDRAFPVEMATFGGG